MTTQLRSDAQRTHDRIFAAATASLAVDPHAGMDVIAQAAGIGRATLYRHFATREALLGALRERFVERLEAASQASLTEDDPRQAVLVWFDMGMRAVADTCTFSGGAADPVLQSRSMAVIETTATAFIEKANALGRLQDDIDASWVVTVGKALIDAGAREIALGTSVDVVAPRVARTAANAFVR